MAEVRQAEEPFLDVAGVAASLGLSVSAVKKIEPAVLPFYRVNVRGDRRYRPADVRAYLDARRVG